MLGFIDRGTKEKILPIVKNNIYSYQSQIINNNDPDEDFPATRIYTDCFPVYQESDFNRLGYILYGVNHSIWFGQGLFNTNSIVGVLSRLKRLTDCFNGLNGNIFYLNLHHDFNNEDYFNGYICSGIFFMECERMKL